MRSMRGRVALLCAIGAVACGTDEPVSSGTVASSDQGRDAELPEPEMDGGGLSLDVQDGGDSLDTGAPRDISDADGAPDVMEPPEEPTPVDAGDDAAAVDASTRDSGSLPPRDGGVDASALDAAADSAPPDASASPDANVDAAADGATVDASTPTEPAPYASFSRVYAILDQSCNNSCHAPGAAYSLDLSTRTLAYLELIGGEGKGAMEFITCANKGLFRVVPGYPGQSVLIQKLENTQPCGDRMPPGGSLSASAIAEIRAWISRGAPND